MFYKVILKYFKCKEKVAEGNPVKSGYFDRSRVLSYPVKIFLFKLINHQIVISFAKIGLGVR